MRVNVFANRSCVILAVGITLFVSGCSESTDPAAVKSISPTIAIAHLLPEATYERALSLASTSQEQTLVESCAQLEGMRDKSNVDQETVQTMQEVLFASETPEVRAVVAAGLGNVGSVSSVPQLLDAMEDASPLTRQAAAKSVGKLMGWNLKLQPHDSLEKWSAAAEQLRERWLLFEGSDLYRVATDPEVRERAGAIAEKRAKFAQRKERQQSGKNSDQKTIPQPDTLRPPQRRPSAEELRRQFRLN